MIKIVIFSRSRYWLSKELLNLHEDLPLLLETKKVNKVEKLIRSTESKEKYVIHIRALEQALNKELVLKKVHRVIQFNQKEWIDRYEYWIKKGCEEMNLKKNSLNLWIILFLGKLWKMWEIIGISN